MTTTTTVTTEATTGRTAVARSRCTCASTSRRITQTTWVKITRLSTGKVIAQRRVAARRPPRRRLAAGRRTASRSRAASPGTSCWPSTGTRSRSTARARSGSSRPTREAAHVEPGKLPPPRRPRTAVTAGRPAAALLITGQELLLGLVADANTRFLAHELDALGIELRRVSIVGDEHDEIAAGLRELAGHDLVITSGRARADARRPHRRGRGRGRRRRAGAGRAAARDDRRHHRGLRAAARDRPGAQSRRRPQAGARAARRDRDPAGGHGARAAARARRRVTCSCCRGRRASWRPSGGGRSSSSRSRPCARARARCCGTRCASTASGSRPWRGRSRPPGATPAARARRSAPARWRWRSRSARSPSGRPRSRPSSPACGSSWARRSTPRTSGRCPSTCSTLLRGRGLRLAVAESCTAGLVAARLADIPGSSDVLLGGVIAYADDVKRELLGVPAALLAEYGAVSAEVARAMAEGARAATGAEVGIAVTGVAGPGGGQRAQAGRARLPARLGARRRARAGAPPDRRPRPGARVGDRGRAAARTHDGLS